MICITYKYHIMWVTYISDWFIGHFLHEVQNRFTILISLQSRSFRQNFHHATQGCVGSKLNPFFAQLWNEKKKGITLKIVSFKTESTLPKSCIVLLSTGHSSLKLLASSKYLFYCATQNIYMTLKNECHHF